MSTSVVLERLPVDPTGSNRFQKNALKRQRVYIFPTTQGWLYALMLIVMLLGAINYNNSMAFMLCFLLTGLGLVCMLHTYRNLTGLILGSRKPNAVFAGQDALFPIHINNLLGNTRCSIRLEQHNKPKKWFYKNNSDNTCVVISVDAGEQTIVNYPYPTIKRGLLKLGRIKISTHFPLGIFQAWSYFEPEDRCLVYPSPQGHKRLPVNISDNDNADYGIQSGTDDFAGFRKYRAGDPINSIAWKAFAREQGLLVKQFSGNGTKTLMFDWDSVANLSDIEARLSQLCYWIIIADKTTLNYGLKIPGAYIEPSHGTYHREQCLKKLASYGMDDA